MLSRIFIYGDSHTQALSNANKARESQSEGIQFDIHWMMSQNKEGISRGELVIEEALEVIQTLSNPDILVISLLGTAHNIFGLLQNSNPYYIVDEFTSVDIPEAPMCMIPRNAMLDMFELWCRKNRRIQKLISNASVRAFHLMTPPPKEDNDFIRSMISRYRGKSVPDVGVADPKLRICLWRLEMEIVSKLGAELHMEIVPPPPATVNERGFLKNEFYGKDATHANSLYGERVLQQLEDLAVKA
jgi:hypothetical protein